MLFVKVQNGLPVEVAEKLTSEQHSDKAWQSRWDWPDFATVARLAKYLTAMTGKTYLPVDNGSGHSPQFDVVDAPKVGDEVSYGFNGDYTPDGTVVKVSPTFQVTTSSGRVYRRKGTTSGWYQAGGTWGLVRGHIDERNPHF
jgi:hypothetical protein